MSNHASIFSAARELQSLRLRFSAIYHNCKSAECFARANAVLEEDEAQAQALRLQADAYSTIAGQLNANLKTPQ